MKKQALAFFTMFSLIMMLSIYYITLPGESKTSKKETSVIAELEKDTKQINKDEIEKNNDAIADSNTSEEEKQKAIIKNEKIKEQEEQQTTYSTLITQLGYENHVEIKEKTIYVSVLNQKEDDVIASTIMKTLYQQIGHNFFIEVSFNS